MKKICLILIVLLTFTTVQSQEFKRISPEKQLSADIEKGNVRLFILGGFVPAITEADRKFEEKYKVRFHDFGCTPPPLDYYKEYNVLAFNYLKEKYGDVWQKEIRENILGWDVWKSSHQSSAKSH